VLAEVAIIIDIQVAVRLDGLDRIRRIFCNSAHRYHAKLNGA